MLGPWSLLGIVVSRLPCGGCFRHVPLVVNVRLQRPGEGAATEDPLRVPRRAPCRPRSEVTTQTASPRPRAPGQPPQYGRRRAPRRPALVPLPLAPRPRTALGSSSRPKLGQSASDARSPRRRARRPRRQARGALTPCATDPSDHSCYKVRVPHRTPSAEWSSSLVVAAGVAGAAFALLGQEVVGAAPSPRCARSPASRWRPCLLSSGGQRGSRSATPMRRWRVLSR